MWGSISYYLGKLCAVLARGVCGVKRSVWCESAVCASDSVRAYGLAKSDERRDFAVACRADRCCESRRIL